ncbi:tyrosine-type recombinase/integrase [Ralstonia chuxiongensis]|nr:site-specific integrase [Ralstonia chuxiongensis]CAJ0780082.1 Tyrosine recombinase XerC [Ralstonia chuxiongensis]
MTPLRERMLHDMQIRNLAENTQKSYLLQVSRFARHFRRSPELLGIEESGAWILYLTNERKLAPSSVQLAVGALRFLYRVTLKREWSDDDFPLPKKPVRLPIILSFDEITRFFEAIPSLKQRAILMAAYAAGLRVSEVVHLEVTDIDSQRMMIRVNQGKGRKDRYVMLSPRLLEILRLYWQHAHPREWLFSGDIPGHPITRSAVGRACKIARQRSGITKLVTPHSLRHARHPSAGHRCRCTQDSTADGASQPYHDGVLPEAGDEHRVRHHQSLRSAATPRTHSASATCTCVFLNSAMRPALEVADIFRRCGPQYRQTHPPRSVVRDDAR